MITSPYRLSDPHSYILQNFRSMFPDHFRCRIEIKHRQRNKNTITFRPVELDLNLLSEVITE